MDSTMPSPENMPEGDLAFAGKIIDKAIEHMMEKRCNSLAIASALLGGALGLLTRTLPDPVILNILQNAMDSVESGDMRRQAGKDHAGEA